MADPAARLSWTTVPTIDIDRDAAQEAAERELSKPIYPRPSPRDQIADLIEALLRKLVHGGAALPGGWFTISLLLLGLAVAVLVAIRTARRTLRTGGGDRRLFGSTERTAEEHRAAAESAAASGDWAEAIRHRLRATARELEQDGVLGPAPGRTANELARDAGLALPGLATEFTRATTVFNDVSYGELPGNADEYRGVADLDDRVRRAAARTGPP